MNPSPPAAGPGVPSLRSLLEADAAVPGQQQAPRPAAVPLPEDLVPAPPPTTFEPRWSGLGASLPPDVALLCVTSTTSSHGPALSLTWHHAGASESAPQEPLVPELPVRSLSLASLVEEAASAPQSKTPWQDAYYEMMNSWSAQDRLHSWIGELTAAELPRLVVWDNTAHEIPWELVYHDPPRGQAGWLGALMPVIRWTSVHDGELVGRLPSHGNASEGGLLMVEDDSLRAKAQIFQPYLSEPAFETLDTLLHRLAEPTGPLGLLLIRCHGRYAPEARSFTLGGFNLNRVTAFPMTALRDSGVPVLLNACSSGRTIQDTRGMGRPVRSFVEVFLRKGAGAVIAVAGEVGVEHSEDFASRLLEDAGTAATNLAGALQDHRRHYARRTCEPSGGETDPRREEDFKLFFVAFLYLYFGHPDASIRMLRNDEGAAS
ncbi:CHAT domain-containing protein [Streptomyces sp. NPDC013161]|uniref:CHAT domain-containing protein n=1 Tax=Streptomyces sp. NPDC013161 TaxID=3364862 RepID=UPI0036B826CF